jgi:hypothetical protein
MKIVRRHPSPVWSLWSQKLCWFLAPFFREAAQTLGAASCDPEAIGNPLWSSLQHMPALPWTRFIGDGQWCDTHHMDQMVSKCLSRVYRKNMKKRDASSFWFLKFISHWTSEKVFSDRGNDSRHDVSDVVQTWGVQISAPVWEQICDGTMYFFKAYRFLAAAQKN